LSKELDRVTSKSIIVTGGAGFIGSAACRLLLSKNAKVICVDKMTYAATKATIAAELQNPNFMLVERDICADCCISDLLVEHSVDAIMNFAAESHVDRSIASPLEFIQTNIVGTYNLLEQARAYYETLTGAAREKFRFLHVSTDEVFGDLEADAMPFNEQSLYQPSSPYSASKASSDHLVRAWQRTYGLPTLLTNCSNNYGPYQFPEKLIPVVIMKCLDDQNIPIYGKGDQVRDWLFVEDHVDAIATILDKAAPGSSYNIGTRNERQNIDIVRGICKTLDRLHPRADQKPHNSAISFVTDRPGHDTRYAIDPSHLENDLGWKPKGDFDVGLERTVQWYLDNQNWWRPLLK